ncbi:MAG: ribonuclease J [Clostridia bacterium]
MSEEERQVNKTQMARENSIEHQENKTRQRRPRTNYRPNLRKNNNGENRENPESKEKIDVVIAKEKTTNSNVKMEGEKRPSHPRKQTNNKNKNENTKFEFKKSNLKIIPLGGLEEIGKNMTVFEYENEIIIVDCGLEFPTDDMLGVDLVIPDVTYLERNKDKIKGLVVTHGHEDHIGAIPYILKQINIPIYATKLTVGLIQNKLEEHKLLRSTKLNIVEAGQTINLGKMQVEFIRSCHSIPDAVMLAIYTPVGTVFHTGDFKIDYTPINSEMTDLTRIAEIGKNGVLALLSDSTNAERKGYTMSESTVGEVFDKLFINCTKRIVVATFASNVHRVQQIVNAAVANRRKIAVCGRSMINMIDTARKLGYIDVPDNVFIDIDMIKNYTDEQLVIITTGSQGETMSALTRMAAGEHRKVEITPNDLVIISASPIPGNEKLVSKVIDDLMQIGAEVVYSSLADVHVSGHACQEEQKLILSLIKPKYFIPVHGEYRQLMSHAETAKKMGVDPKNIFLSTNGRILELNEKEAKLTVTVPSGKILVDGLGVGDVGNVVLRDRQHLSQDGLIVIVMTMDNATGEIVAGPDVISRGFVYVKESENLMEDVKKVIREEVKSLENQDIRDWSTIKSTLKDNLRDYIFQKTKRNPMILPIIMAL